MKCKNCGAELRKSDKVCLNCGELVSSTEDDLYNDINIDEEDEYQDGETYNKELVDLLNSYEQDKNNNTNINNTSNNDYNNYSDFDESNDKSDNNELDDYSLDNLVEFTDNYDNNDSEFDEYSINNIDGDNKKSISIIPFKLVFIISIVVLLVIIILLGYKYIVSKKEKDTTVEIKPNDEEITSKYSLTENPNYINNKTWVCGERLEDGSLTTDSSTYFQYDFNTDKSYARQFLTREDTYESGTYGLSLEEITDTTYTYKLTMIANLSGGYKTRYTFTLITNKEGTKATYKYNSTIFSCEEMDYYNNKYK